MLKHNSEDKFASDGLCQEKPRTSMFFARKEQPRKICREKGNVKIWRKRSQEYAWAREERNLTKTRKRRDSKAIRMHHGVARVHSPTSQRHSSTTPLFTLTLGDKSPRKTQAESDQLSPLLVVCPTSFSRCQSVLAFQDSSHG